MNIYISIAVSIFTVISVVYTENAFACQTPGGIVETKSVSTQKPSCLDITNQDDSLLAFYQVENQCGRPLKIVEKDCKENCEQVHVSTQDEVSVRWDVSFYDQWTDYGPDYDETFVFTMTLGKPNTDIDQAFDDEQANLSFEVALRFIAPDKEVIDAVIECQNQQEDMNGDSTADMNVGEMSSFADMSDMSDMQSSSSSQNDESTGCNSTHSKPISTISWLFIFALFCFGRKQQRKGQMAS